MGSWNGAKARAYGGGAAGPAIDRVKSTTSCTRHPTVQHPPSSIQRPASTAPRRRLPSASAIHPRARCIIVRPHGLAPTSSTCPGQAARALVLMHTRAGTCTRTWRGLCARRDGHKRGRGASVCDVIKPPSTRTPPLPSLCAPDNCQRPTWPPLISA